MRNHSNSVKIRHTTNAKDRLTQAHKVMGLANKLSVQMEGVFNQWAKVRITDPEVKKLIQLAMVPNKEVLQNITAGKMDELSTAFTNIVDRVYDYAMNDSTQQTTTTRGTLFGAYNAVSGYFQNVRTYKTPELKLNSVMGGTAQLRTQSTFNLCQSFADKGADGLILN